MTNLEQLKHQYKDLSSRADFSRKMLDGVLNRIAITDDDIELNRLIDIIHKYIDDYIQLARQSHNAWTLYHNTLFR